MASSAQWLTFTKPFCGIAIVFVLLHEPQDIFQVEAVGLRRVIRLTAIVSGGRGHRDSPGPDFLCGGQIAHINETVLAELFLKMGEIIQIDLESRCPQGVL